MFKFFRRKKRSQRPRRQNYGRRLRFEGLEGRRMLATISVSTNADGPIDSSDPNVSLREAIAFVNGAATPSPTEFNQHIMGTIGQDDTIVFESTLSGDIINLDPAQYYELVIFRSVTIDASMLAEGITINAGGGTDGVVGNGNGHPVIVISSSGGTQVEINGLKITGGDPEFGGGKCACFALAV